VKNLAHEGWLALETLHALSYFAPETAESLAEIGIVGRDGYFAARSAAMGAVDPGVTVATFYVFAPRAVEASLPAVWSTAAPAEVLRARYAGVRGALHRLLGDPDVSEAATLAAELCEGLGVHGRPLFAGHASVAWPDEPLMQLWHAATLVREHRGDGHVNVLLHAGVRPLDALVLNGLVCGSTDFMERRRGWTQEEWADARAGLVARRLLTPDHQLSDQGRALTEHVEDQTEQAALEGWQHLGEARARRLVELLRPVRAAVVTDPALPGWLARRS
jgi:hypothetical protein